MSHKPAFMYGAVLICALLIGLPACQKTEKGPKHVSKKNTQINPTKAAQKFTSLQKEYFTLKARYEMEEAMIEKHHSVTDEDERITKQKASLNTIVMKRIKDPKKYYPSSRAWGDFLMAFCVDDRYMSSTQVPFATYSTYLNRDKKRCQKNLKQLDKITTKSEEITKLRDSYACLLENLAECSLILSLNENRLRDQQMRHLSISPSRY